MVYLKSKVTCTATNCQSTECTPLQVFMGGDTGLVWTCSDFKKPCECTKDASGGDDDPIDPTQIPTQIPPVVFP